MKRIALIIVSMFVFTHNAYSAEMTVQINIAEKAGIGADIGNIKIVETQYGLVFYPSLKTLPAGLHGFHIHEKPSCAPGEKDGNIIPALAAGGHFDPQNSTKHGEPWGDGHLGDLPPLYINETGFANTPVLSPRLKLKDIMGRSLMIHAGGDNHADHPLPLGGGGPRIACGIIDTKP